MNLKQSDLKRITDYLETQVGQEGIKCSVCRRGTWSISRTVAELRPFQKGSLSLGGGVLPVVVFICMTCGHTLFFNAITLGIVEIPPKESSNDATPPQEKEDTGNE